MTGAENLFIISHVQLLPSGNHLSKPDITGEGLALLA
jgi:hypothetical protein